MPTIPARKRKGKEVARVSVVVRGRYGTRERWRRGKIQPSAGARLGGACSARGDGRRETRSRARVGIESDSTRSSRDRHDPPRRVRRYRAPALPARLVSRHPSARLSAKSSRAGTLKTRMGPGRARGSGAVRAAILTDFLGALSHPVESDAKGNARRPLATRERASRRGRRSMRQDPRNTARELVSRSVVDTGGQMVVIEFGR